MIRHKSLFEIAHENLRSALRYLRHELGVPADSVRAQVEGILRSFAIEELNEKRTPVHTEPKGPEQGKA